MPSCGACGADSAFGAGFCSACGAPLGEGERGAGHLPGVAGGTAPSAWAGRFRRLGLGGLVAGVALVVVFVGLLMPWLTVGAFGVALGSEDGFNGWGWLSFVALLGAVVVLLGGVRRHAANGAPGAPSARSVAVTGGLVMVAGGAALLGVVVFWASAPSALLGVSVGAGLIVSLIGSLGVIAGGAMMRSPTLTGSVQARLRGPGSG